MSFVVITVQFTKYLRSIFEACNVCVCAVAVKTMFGDQTLSRYETLRVTMSKSEFLYHFSTLKLSSELISQHTQYFLRTGLKYFFFISIVQIVCIKGYDCQNCPLLNDKFQTSFDSWSFFFFAAIPKKLPKALETNAKVIDKPE